MMLNEFIAEVKRLLPQSSEKELMATFGRPSHWEAVQLFYRSRHLDRVATGKNRHRRFVVWLFRHELRVRKVIKRFQRERQRCLKAVERQMVDAKFEYERKLAGLRITQQNLKEEPDWVKGVAA